MSTGVVEEVDRSDLTYTAIKARSDAFNHAFARNGGYKGYEVQAIESLLAQLESAHDAQRTAEQETVRALSAHALEVRQLRGELAALRQQVKSSSAALPPRVTYAEACKLLADYVVAVMDRTERNADAESHAAYMKAVKACTDAMGAFPSMPPVTTGGLSSDP